MFTNFNEEPGENDTIICTGYCIITGEQVVIKVPRSEYEAYYIKGELAQNAFKSLTPTQREFFISGVGESGWKRLYGDDD